MSSKRILPALLLTAGLVVLGLGCGKDKTTEPDTGQLVNPGTQYGKEEVAFSLTVQTKNTAAVPTITDGGTTPEWATFADNGDGTATISGMPLFGLAGTYPVTLTVDDGTTADGGSFNVVVNPSAYIESYAGTGEAAQGGDGLPPDQTALYWPQGIDFGPDGTAYIADWNNHRIRMVKNGIAQTIIGTGELGDALDGPGLETKLNHPTGVSFDPNGNLIMNAWHNSKVMRYDFGTKIIQTICGNGQRSYGGDGGPAEDAVLDLPVTTVWDSFNRMYIMDQANQRIRFVENGVIETFAGVGPPLGYAGDGGLAKEARFNLPVGQAASPAGKIAIDDENNIYVADTGNHIVRKILSDEAPAPGTRPFHETNIIQLFAGTAPTCESPNCAVPGSTGENVPATEATLRYPLDVAVGPDGNVYIADTFNHCIRRVDKNGIIITYAGKLGARGYGGDGGHPTQALLDQPSGISFGPDGDLYIADRVNNRIRVVRRIP